jgi:hypothetical protein
MATKMKLPSFMNLAKAIMKAGRMKRTASKKMTKKLKSLESLEILLGNYNY